MQDTPRVNGVLLANGYLQNLNEKDFVFNGGVDGTEFAEVIQKSFERGDICFGRSW
jgi:hypothetical protein